MELHHIRNFSVIAREGNISRAAISMDGLIPKTLDAKLVFRPLAPTVYASVYLAWKERAELPPAATALVRLVRARVEDCIELKDFASALDNGKEKRP